MFGKKMKNITHIPNHVAIIMDGNGRWARRRGLPRHLGHKMGVKTLGDTIKVARKLGIKVLTVFAFSTENWNRPQAEVDFIMDEIVNAYERNQTTIKKEAIRIKVIGERYLLKPEVLKVIDKVTEQTKDYEGFTLVIAFNYGGQQEIVNALKNIATKVNQGKLSIDKINQALITNELYTAHLPPVDLLIRTSGEMRISNFLLWQLAYAEMYFTPVLWPSFNERELLKAIKSYQKRDRRFGKIGE